MSLAYSGSIWATVPVPRVAKCQARMKATKIAMDTIAARKLREPVILRRLPHTDFLILKLFRYSSGFAASKVLPMTTNVFEVVAGGVSPASFINFEVSVARNTCLAMVA